MHRYKRFEFSGFYVYVLRTCLHKSLHWITIRRIFCIHVGFTSMFHCECAEIKIKIKIFNNCLVLNSWYCLWNKISYTRHQKENNVKYFTALGNFLELYWFSHIVLFMQLHRLLCEVQVSGVKDMNSIRLAMFIFISIIA